MFSSGDSSSSAELAALRTQVGSLETALASKVEEMDMLAEFHNEVSKKHTIYTSILSFYGLFWTGSGLFWSELAPALTQPNEELAALRREMDAEQQREYSHTSNWSTHTHTHTHTHNHLFCRDVNVCPRDGFWSP